MNDDTARTAEFGTGLRARLERDDRSRSRPSAPSSRDLLHLHEDDSAKRPHADLVRVAGELAPRGPQRVFAA